MEDCAVTYARQETLSRDTAVRAMQLYVSHVHRADTLKWLTTWTSVESVENANRVSVLLTPKFSKQGVTIIITVILHLPVVLVLNAVTLSECSNTQNSNCSCHKGFLCISPECDVCQKEVICPRGHQLTKTGNYQYAYYCKPCPDGMYSDTEGGVCKPLQRCDQETIFPGNKTHNSKCKTQSPDPTKEPHKASVNMELTLLVILLLCVFTCLAVLVNACKSKAACMKWKQTKKPMKASPSTTVFQLSKEERGDRPIQEIDKHPSLTSLMTE
ncbi:tumor necrosis factor receptor superfamily member 18 isoform X1 [Conger conger]|uniref:tumor necrosis factor receptor superfamily member 18 isoform X1 n=1 Tax=Conger conger TaxID=82655 RepID=UPI002A5A7B17|nr:tumor necrosis factor receptor superfamily member 18 isoform X1 [Conger conger]